MLSQRPAEAVREDASSLDGLPPQMFGRRGDGHALHVEPLRCPGCGASVALSGLDAVRCQYCGSSVPVPAHYQELHAQNAIAAADRRKVEAAYARLGHPPGRLLRQWATAARYVWGGLYLSIIVSLLVLLSLPEYVADWAAAWAPALGLDLIDMAGAWGTTLVITVSFFGLLVLPLLVVTYKIVVGDLRAMLGVTLAAREPTTPGGPSTCRACGAPLDIAEGSLGVRCGYCGSDNLVALPPDLVARVRDRHAVVHKRIDALLADERSALWQARKKLLKRGALSALAFSLTALWWERILEYDEDPPTNWQAAIAEIPRRISPNPEWKSYAEPFPAGVRRTFPITSKQCRPYAGPWDRTCVFTFVVSMRKSESLHLDVTGLPPDALVTAKTLRDKFLPELPLRRTEGASDASSTFVAPYAGWFKVNLVMPPVMQGSSLTLEVRVDAS